MKKMLIKTVTGAMNGMTNLFRKHPVISYVGFVGPAILLLAAGYTAVQEGFYFTEADDEKKED